MREIIKEQMNWGNRRRDKGEKKTESKTNGG